MKINKENKKNNNLFIKKDILNFIISLSNFFIKKLRILYLIFNMKNIKLQKY